MCIYSFVIVVVFLHVLHILHQNSFIFTFPSVRLKVVVYFRLSKVCFVSINLVKTIGNN